MEGLSCGVPLVVLPQHGDQFGMAARVACHRAGLVLNAKWFDLGAVRTAIERATSDPVYRVSAVRMREAIERTGYGFHHWGVATWSFDAAVAQYERAGYALAFRAAVPSGGRVGYMDTTAVLPGYTELIELGGAFEEVFGRFYRASIDWDGQDPVRSFI